MRQSGSLGEYFLKVLPRQGRFKGKIGVGASERYTPIKNAFSNKSLPTIVKSVN